MSAEWPQKGGVPNSPQKESIVQSVDPVSTTPTQFVKGIWMKKGQRVKHHQGHQEEPNHSHQKWEEGVKVILLVAVRRTLKSTWGLFLCTL